MELLARVTEAEVIAEFLRAELDSPRYGARIRELLEGGETLITHPRLDDADENAARARLLDRHRGWLRREGLFNGLPDEIAWFTASVTRRELLSILYIDWDWWLELSGGTRSPLDAARRIRAGKVPGSETGEEEALAAHTPPAGTSAPLPRLIVLAPPDTSRLVVLEGHARLTSYALSPERAPESLEILLGLSDRIEEWTLF